MQTQTSYASKLAQALETLRTKTANGYVYDVKQTRARYIRQLELIKAKGIR